MSKDQNALILDTNLQSFFYDQLTIINKKSTNPLPEHCIYYSSKVMDKFSEAEKYFENVDGKVREKVLGLKYLESNHLPRNTQKRVLKDVGDTALILCGFFGESLNKKIVDSRYYHDIGMAAYSQLDSIVPEVYEIPAFYKTLSSSFVPITNIISILTSTLNLKPDQSQVLFFASNTKIKAS
jgi:hypothetical protein